jgi:hypothetical protein
MAHRWTKTAFPLLGVCSVAVAALALSGSPVEAAQPHRSDRCLVFTGTTTGGRVAQCVSDPDPTEPPQIETGGTGTFSLVPSPTGGTITITWKPPYELTPTGAPATTSFSFKLTHPATDEVETKMCPATTTEFNLLGTVTKDTTDPPGTDTDVGKPVTAEICRTSSSFTLEPGSSLSFYD